MDEESSQHESQFLDIRQKHAKAIDELNEQLDNLKKNKTTLEKAKTNLEAENTDMANELKTLNSAKQESDRRRKQLETLVTGNRSAKLTDTERIKSDLSERTV